MLTYGSVCSGIEAASVAWEPLGMNPLWFSQFDPEHNYKNGPDFPSAVLAYHWPHITNHGDMTKLPNKILSGDIDAPDILVGGTPCQAYSVAGLRNGLSDERGVLTIKFMELANDIDSVRAFHGKPESIIVWENVPGVLSSKDNAFGCFLSGLAGEDCELQPSGKKWTNAGCVFGPKRTVAWRVLDAQYFGLAQRRKRVFVVASARKDINPCKILFEQEGLRRDIAPSRETQKETSSGIKDSVRKWPADLASTLNAAFGSKMGLEDQHINGGAPLFVPVSFPAFMSGTQYSSAKNISLCIGSKNQTGIATNIARRITPVEAERLQGFSDGHTNIPYKNKPVGDGHRYKSIGNSMAVPVMRWIGERIIESLKSAA